ncbi:hypothetical protein [Ottowia sp.]|uniref:hypothetical protein n=1 Tax=Ottowia sp. TaxID=1898956 RepID=UPI0039E39D7E
MSNALGCGPQVAEFPFDVPPIQASLIAHRKQQHAAGLRWLKEQVLQVSGKTGPWRLCSKRRQLC